MAWIDIEDSLPSHRKTLEVADDLGIEPVQLVGHLTCFWLWATNNADNDGYLPDGIRPKTLARAAFWTGDADAFVRALSDRFLEVAEDGRMRIHDWNQHYGKFADQRERDAERKRNERAADNQRSSADGRRTTRRTSNGHVADVQALAQAQTGPDLTGPNQSEDTECHSDSELCASAREGRGPDEASPRAAPEEVTEVEGPPPQWEPVAPGIWRGNPNGKGEVTLLPPPAVEWCPACRTAIPAAEFEAHFAQHDIAPQPPGAVERFLSGRSLKQPKGKLAAQQPEYTTPPTAEEIAAYEQRMASIRAGPAPAVEHTPSENGSKPVPAGS